jgi:2'-5' RNA ligase
MRLFVALPIPEPVEDGLWPLQDGVPGAIWTAPGDHHLTLRFLGEVQGDRVEPLVAGLARLRLTAFALQLRGVGFFPPRGQPRTLWAGVADRAPLDHLHAKIDGLCGGMGLGRDPRQFAPHVTLAKLHDSPPHRVAAWLAGHAQMASEPWTADRFCLYRSRPGSAGSDYEVLASFALGAGPSP